MKIFLSWSGEVSKRVALMLRKYLPCMIQGLSPFMSKHDLQSGVRWGIELAQELEQSNFGVICLTPDNLTSPWLLFEAGALTKHMSGRVCCLLIANLDPVEISGPLAQFQNRTFEEAELRSLLVDLNNLLPTPLSGDQLGMVFGKWWPDLYGEYQDVIGCYPLVQSPQREAKEILNEILIGIRNMERDLADFTGARPPDGSSLLERFEYAWSLLSDEQRSLLLELGERASDKAAILERYRNADARALTIAGFFHRRSDGTMVPNPHLIAEFIRIKKDKQEREGRTPNPEPQADA